jgi:hypothetical protein
MTLFDSRVTHLKNVRLRDASLLTMPGLKSLRGHKIVELEASGTRPTCTRPSFVFALQWMLFQV